MWIYGRSVSEKGKNHAFIWIHNIHLKLWDANDRSMKEGAARDDKDTFMEEKSDRNCYCSRVRNALNCAFREKTYSLKSKNPFAKQILHGFLPVTGTE